jgi:hypothetical protein
MQSKLPRLFPLLLSTAAMMIVCSEEATAAEATRASILCILADDLGVHDPHCFGSTFHETPNIDRLAARGVQTPSLPEAGPRSDRFRRGRRGSKFPAVFIEGSRVQDYARGAQERPAPMSASAAAE